jgi:hypothetical protein
MNLVEVAEEIQHRIIHIFGRDMEGKRATNGGNVRLDQDPHFRDYVSFYEVMMYFTAGLTQKLTLSSSSMEIRGAV